MDLPRYYLVGSWERPIKVIETKDNGMTILAFDWETGEFIEAPIYGNTLFASTDDVQRVIQAEFEKHVTQERSNVQPNPIILEARKLAVQQSEVWSQIDVRMKERLEEYEWQPERILNFLQSSIVYETLDNLYLGIEKMVKEQQVIRFLDRITKPLDDGYRDALINIRMSNGHIAEISFEIKSIQEFHNQHALTVYSEIRAINKKVISEQRDYSTAERKQIGLLQSNLRLKYENIFKRLIH